MSVRCALLASPAALSLLMASTAQAAIYSVTSTSLATTFHESRHSDLSIATDNAAVTVSSGQMTDEPGANYYSLGQTSGWASAGPGRLQLYTDTLVQHDATLAIGAARASSGVSALLDDSFIIGTQGCASCTLGSVGTMRFSFSISGSGSLATSGSIVGGSGLGSYRASSDWSTYLNLDSGAPAGLAEPSSLSIAGGLSLENNTGLPGSTANGLGTGLHSFTLSFVYGTPITLSWTAYAGSAGEALSGGDETAFNALLHPVTDFSQTFAWAGITSVTDATGQAVAQYSALNEDGLDYVQSFTTAPVPEPRAWLLMGAGLLALTVLQRRRSARS